MIKAENGRREMIKTENNNRSRYFLLYSLLFTVTALSVFLPFIIHHKSLVFYDSNGGGDGLVIHYNSFVYYGKYLRSIIRSIIHDGKLAVPMWDMHIGFGQDIIQTLWFYAIGDPFAFLSVFIPTRFSEIGYCAVIILELYCAGLAFSCYAFRMRKVCFAVLPAAMIYVFSAYPLLISIMHPYFTLPLILLPLLLIGVERLMERRFDLFFVFMILLSACACFYFFYMLCIFVFLYAVYRYFCTQKFSIKNFLMSVLKYLLNTLLGVGLSSVLLFPVIHSLLFSSRVNASNFVPLLYPLDYYEKILLQIMNGGGNYYNHQGYTALGLMSLIMLFIMLKKNSRYKRYLPPLFALSIFVLFPFFGHMFNGFAYVTNRWIWAMDCFMAFLIATMLPEIGKLTNKEWNHVIWISIGWCLLALGFKVNRTDTNYINVIVLLILLFVFGFFREGIFKPDSRSYRAGFLGLTVLVVSLNAWLIYSSEGGNYISLFGEMGEAYSELVEHAPGAQVKKLDDNTLFRYDTAGINTGKVKRNSDMLLKTNGTSHYYSSNGGDYSVFFNNMEYNNPMDQTYDNLNRRRLLEALLGVKYVVIPKGYEHVLPYGFTQMVSEGEDYCVYSTEDVLPLAFTTNRIIDPEQYERGSSLEKQQMQLQGICVEAEKSAEGSYVEVDDNSLAISYEIGNCDGAEVKDNSITVTKENGSIVLNLLSSDIPAGEMYCRFANLNYLEKNEKTGWLDKYVSDVHTLSILSLEPDIGTSAQVLIMNNQNACYCGHHSFLATLGYLDQEQKTIKISFNNPGIYSFDAIEIWVQPLTGIHEQVRLLPDYPVADLQYDYDVNKLYGSAKAGQDEYLFLSFLYSPGWTAFVDGEKVPVYKADGSFIAIPVPKGEHVFELRYRTPLILEGLFVTVSSVIVLIFVCLTDWKRKRKMSAIVMDREGETR